MPPFRQTWRLFLYNKTEGGVKLLALNTLGVLYMVTKNEEVASIADLKGKNHLRYR